MVRKQRKKVDEKLKDITNQFNDVFKEIQDITTEFVHEINKGEVTNFSELFEKYDSKLRNYSKQIPTIQRTIRDYGIY